MAITPNHDRTQTDDMLRTLHQRSDSLVIDGINLPACALSAVKALERIADALEARNVIDGQMAEFAELLQQGAPQVAHEGHPDLAPDGMPRKRR